MGVGRAIALAIAIATTAPLVACSGEPEPSPDPTPSFGGGTTRSPTGSTTTPSQEPAPEPGKAQPGTQQVAPPAGIDPATASHPEVVYILMEGKDTWIWFCTGTLVSKNVVVTAAHCLQSSLFLSWEVVAPTVAGTPRVKASGVMMYDSNWQDVSHPDLGIVKLEMPITLNQYGVLTDVSARVDAGQTTMGGAIVRTAEKPEAPFKKTDPMKLSSTVKYGYDHGYGLPLFSHGGDSGAGLFLVENNVMTHKLIAVERQPEPSRNLDHLTRVEPAFADWVTKNTPP